MSFTLKSLKYYRDALVRRAEIYAVEHDVIMAKAGQVIVNDPENRQHVWNACGNWYTGKPPSSHVVRKWYNQDKLKVAKEWPNPSDEALKLVPEGIDPYDFAAPYLKRKHRCKKPRVNEKISHANDLASKGKSPQEIADELGVSLSTVYRWKAQQ